MGIQNNTTRRNYPCRARQKSAYRERRTAGVCVRGCGEPATKYGMCDEHAAKCSSYRRIPYDKGMSPTQVQRVKDGLCRICELPRGEDGTRLYCRPHADEMRARTERWQQKRANPGLAYCGHPLDGTGKATCLPCFLRRAKRKSGYILAPDEYLAMREHQGGHCGICNTKPQVLYVDHCHNTGSVRGLLCSQCNTGIGMFKDDPARLASAIKYLARSPKT